tara:strand:+ start:1005 stop:2321 length:1317 start_codon:yes stop_codon:yes gene_type:complete
MNYMSLCSGVEAISVAWKGLGFNPVAFSEIEKFPSAVLEHHYPNVPNYGDMTNYKEWKNDGTVGLIVGGTPCQSFSIAGLRKGLEDPRGNLMLTFGAIIKKYRPTWLLWENVPGVLSSNKGRDFGTFLAMLGQFGYGYAYRVLDAQHFGVAQRRRRVFVVGYLGDWRNPAKVLFEQESLRGDTQKGKKKEQGTAENSCNGSGASGEGLEIPKLAPTLTGNGAGLSRPGNQWQEDSWYIPTVAGSLDTECGGNKLTHQSMENGHILPEKAPTLCANLSKQVTNQMLNNADAYFHIVPEKIGTLTTRSTTSTGARDVEEGFAFPVTYSFDSMNGNSMKSPNPHSGVRETETATTLVTRPNTPEDLRGGLGIVEKLKVRRLTPIEAERLQGFEDDYTRIPYRGKPKEQCPDGPRYKAMGNSMAVPVVRWIGQRIKMVNDDV